MSKEYVIMTDSSCDLPQELADQLGLEVLPLEAISWRERERSSRPLR